MNLFVNLDGGLLSIETTMQSIHDSLFRSWICLFATPQEIRLVDRGDSRAAERAWKCDTRCAIGWIDKAILRSERPHMCAAAAECISRRVPQSKQRATAKLAALRRTEAL